MTQQKIIIHIADGLTDKIGLELVGAVIRQGKVSADGKSYCYASRFSESDYPKKIMVTTDKPRRGTNTHVFYVHQESQ